MHTPVLSWQRCPGDAISGDGVIGESCRNGSTSCTGCTGSTGWTSYTGWRAYVLPLFQKNPDILNQVSISKMSWGTTLPIWHNILQKPHILSTRWSRKSQKKSERLRKRKSKKMTSTAWTGFPQGLRDATAATLPRTSFTVVKKNLVTRWHFKL